MCFWCGTEIVKKTVPKMSCADVQVGRNRSNRHIGIAVILLHISKCSRNKLGGLRHCADLIFKNFSKNRIQQCCTTDVIPGLRIVPDAVSFHKQWINRIIPEIMQYLDILIPFRTNIFIQNIKMKNDAAVVMGIPRIG